MQLVLADSETIIVGAPSLGLSELQCFEEHAPEYRICTLYAGKVIDERRQARSCQKRDRRFRTPRRNGNAKLAKGQRGWLCDYRGLRGLDVRDWPARRVIPGGQFYRLGP